MISKFSVKKPYTIFVGVVMVIILGIVSLTKMTADLLPNINLPYVIVMTTYVGASPETVETVVTKPVESSMATVSNVDNISSVSSENYSMVIMEFVQSANMDSASLEIREKLDQIKPYWDESVGNPIIMKLNPNMLPIMVAAVGMEGMTISEISDYTKNQLLPELESIEGVASASASGLLQEQVNVIIREDKIAAVNKQIFDAIDEEMADAKKEIEDGKKELADGKQELADGWKEIDENVADMEEAKNDLFHNKNELTYNKQDLENGKWHLQGQKDAVAAQLAENHAKLIDAKSQIAAGKGAIQSSMAQMQQQLSAIEGKESLLTAQSALAAYKTANGMDDTAAMMTPWESVKESFGATEQAIIDGLAQAMQGQGVPVTLGALELAVQTQLSSPTMAGIDVSLKPTLQAGLAEMENQLAVLAAQEAEIDAGLEALVKGQITSAAGFGSAEAQIAYGQAQVEMAEKQLESAQEQLDSGMEQIDAAKDQLREAEDQLKEAEEQLRDGEEQLEEARQDAYLSADMAGVLTVNTVKSLLVAQNFSMPGGYVTEDGVDYLVRVGDKPEDVDALAAMPLLNLNMDGVDVVTLGDVADVFMTDNSDEIYANLNGNPGVLISLQKQTGYSTGDVSNKINDKFEDIMEENPGISLIGLMDQGIYIDMVMDSIFSNIIVGFGLAMLILIIFLKDYRPTLIIACSIPISLVAAIVLMYFSGVTLNIISLSGLALAIGMLVDNSIVVIENIYRLRSEGASVKEAAIEGAKEVAGAIVASTMTTVCVFLPIVFTEGITRQLFVDMGLTIGYSLVASLIMALTVVPAMASKMLTGTKDATAGGISEKLSSVLEKVLVVCLRRKWLVIFGTLVLLVSSVALSLSKGTAFMPEMDSNQLSMTITPPENTSTQDVAKISDEIVSRLETLDDVQDIGAMMSDDSTSMMGGSTGTVSIYITTKEDKKLTNIELGKEIESMLSDIEGVEIAIQTASMDMSALGGSGVSIQVRGRELDTLQEVAKEVAKTLETVEGIGTVSDGLEKTSGEMRVLIDREKAMDYGLTVGQVFSQISAKLAEPTSATTLTTAIKEYDVYVVNEVDEALTREALQAVLMEGTNEDGKKVRVPLSVIATFEETRSLQSIQREEQTRYINVTGTIADGYNVGLVSADVEKTLENLDIPNGYSLHFGGENETIMEAMGQLALMLVLAIAFMYLIMVVQFQSLKSPFIIMFTIPLAFTGGFLALFLSGSEVSVISIIGFVMLSGIIVNNGIVLVDYMNQLRERGMAKTEAILEASRTRLRPVLMTALTTILGLVPMVVGGGMGADMSRPMALVTIGGLTYGTLLTLIVIPCIYDIFHPEKKAKAELEEVTEV